MIERIAIVGAGGFGREVALMIQQINSIKRTWELIGFFDDGIQKDFLVDEVTVIGTTSELNECDFPLAVVIAIADSKIRESIFKSITNTNISFPSISHPSAILGSPKNVFQEGVIIGAGSILTTGIHLGSFTIVNLNCTIGHDVITGNFCTIMPGSNISGNIQIGDFTLIGTGVQVIQNLSVGSNCIIGAGSVVTHDINSGQKVAGIPARSLQ